MTVKHRKEHFLFVGSSYSRCIGVHVPSVQDIISMYTSTGVLPPRTELVPIIKNDIDDSFDTDIRYRDPKVGMEEQFNSLNEVYSNVRQSISSAQASNTVDPNPSVSSNSASN